MSLKEFFPTYPLFLRSPRGFKIKFGTRSLYVDLPWQAYYFLQLAMRKAVKSGLSVKEVREEWNRFLEANKEVLTFKGKPFVSISLRPTVFGQKESYLRLDVKWRIFIKYLDEKAKRFVSEIEESGENIMKVYKEIWFNFFSITGIITPPKPAYFPFSRERFRKLLKRTGDYYQIESLLGGFEEIISQVEEAIKDEAPSIQLYTTNLMMDIQHLRSLIDVVDIPAAHLLLRNFLESLIKLLVYYKIGKSMGNSDSLLSSMFLYEYEATKAVKKPRVYSLGNFKREFIRKISKTTPNDDLLNIIEQLKKLQTPTLGVNPQVLKELSETYELNVHLDKLYSACSSVIHNQPPLPFFSLLEVKFFKYFLEKYLNSLQIIAEKLTGSKIEMKETYRFTRLKGEGSLKRCLEAVHELQVNYRSELRNAIKESLKEIKGFWVRPLVLAAIFHLISPSLTNLRKLPLTEEDLKDVVERLMPLSFRIDLLHEVYETLNALQDALIPKLEKYKAFSSLQSEEKKKLTIFYLLLLYLPEVIEEIMEESSKEIC